MFSENCFICNAKLNLLYNNEKILNKKISYYICPKECCVINYVNNIVFLVKFYSSSINYPKSKDGFEIIFSANKCIISVAGENNLIYYNDNALEIFNLFLKNKSLKKLLLIQ